MIDYGYGHTHVLLRGVADPDEGDDPGVELRVADFLFINVARISCWRDFVRFSLRRPTDSDRAVLNDRLPGMRPDDAIFLLEADSIESYIIAGRVYWAEFDIGHGGESPLTSEDPEYREANPPVRGVVNFAE